MKLERPDVRAHVLRAALLAIDEVGPDRLRVRDIAERAGMSSGHVMYYFGKRDRILVSTLLLSEDELAERRTAELATVTDPREAVGRLVEMYLPAGAGDVRWRLWAQIVARPPQDEETLARIAGFTGTWARELARIVIRGWGRGCSGRWTTRRTTRRGCAGSWTASRATCCSGCPAAMPGGLTSRRCGRSGESCCPDRLDAERPESLCCGRVPPGSGCGVLGPDRASVRGWARGIRRY